MRFHVAQTALGLGLVLHSLCSAAAEEIRRYDAGAQREVDFHIDRDRDPIYPARLRAEGFLEGNATFAVSINHFGELDDYLLLEASHQEFAKAVEKVLPTWDYSVPRINGEPAAIVSTVKVTFDRSGVIVYETTGAVQLNPFASSSDSYRVYGLWELDNLPEPLHVEKPEFHVDLLENRHLATAVFEFYIDIQGRVRMPTLREADDGVDERLLLIAQDKLLQWRFEPPTVRGKPVVARAAQPFRFRKGAVGVASD